MTDDAQNDAPAIPPEIERGLRKFFGSKYDLAIECFPKIARWWQVTTIERARDRGINADLVFAMLIPAAGLRPHHRHELAMALNGWLIAARPHCSHCIESSGLSDLMAGEPPKPMSIRFMQLGRPDSARRNPLPREPDDSVRGWRLNLEEFVLGLVQAAIGATDDGDHRNIMIAAIGEPEFSRAEITESLRAAIPPDLVDDVIVGGRSWNEP